MQWSSHRKIRLSYRKYIALRRHQRDTRSVAVLQLPHNDLIRKSVNHIEQRNLTPRPRSLNDTNNIPKTIQHGQC